MGFGWLFIGYFATTFMTLNPAGSAIRLVGYGVILMAVWKLRRYHRAFDWAAVGTALMLLIAASLALSDLSGWLYDYALLSFRLIPEGAETVIGYAEKVVSLLFHGALLWSIRKIALETEVPKIAVSAVRNFVFICIYYILYVVSSLPFAFIQNARGAWVAMTWLVWLIWIVLNHVLIFSCYARICDEADVDMEQKPSRFAFVNRFREENERRQQKAREEQAAYQREKREKNKSKKRRK